MCRKVFDIVDRDRSGFLSKREAKRACKLIGEKFGVAEVYTIASKPGLWIRISMESAFIFPPGSVSGSRREKRPQKKMQGNLLKL